MFHRMRYGLDFWGAEGGDDAEVYGFGSQWNFGGVEEGRVVRSLGFIGEASVTESGYLFEESIYPVGGIVPGAHMVIFLHLT